MSRLQPSVKKIRRDSMDESHQESDGLPTSQELMEMCSSPDPFAESPPLRNVSHVGGGDISSEEIQKSSDDSDELREVVINTLRCTDVSPSKATDLGAGESSKADREDEFTPWRGCPLSGLQKGPTQYGVPQIHPIKPSSYHTVMFQLPGSKEPFPAPQDIWDMHHVRLPSSPKNLYPVGESLKSRWEMVVSALRKPIKNSKELEKAIMSYNRKYATRWNFTGLHEFFNEVIEVEEKDCFFADLLPQMVELALKLPEVVTRPLPLLRQHQNRSISLTQQQVACLLVNAFFCTFPRRNASKQASEYSSFPDINFNRLFQEQRKKIYKRRTHEKLKCLFHYFRRICYKPPTGTLTYTRQYISSCHIPNWEYSSHYFRKLHVASKGTIEDYGKGMLQVDFAHKMVGGGVLGWGCVQEEIRFVICPELIVARLFTECLAPSETLLITGAEQYSTYEGYADTFMWDGDYQDETPRDSSGRLLCTVVAMDALSLRFPMQQYNIDNIIREANKAYAGFFNMDVSNDNLSAVATGNWGCGVYRGNPQLKALIQLLAAAQTGRSMAYFTFGNIQLRDSLSKLHAFLVENRATVGLVWRHMCQYHEQCYRNGSFVMDLYDFIHKSMDPNYTVKLSPVKGRKALIVCRNKLNLTPKKTSPDNKEKSLSKKHEVKGKLFPVFSIYKPINKTKSPLRQTKRSHNSKELNEAVKGKMVQPTIKTETVVVSNVPSASKHPPNTQRANSSPAKRSTVAPLSKSVETVSTVSLSNLPERPKVLITNPSLSKTAIAAGDSSVDDSQFTFPAYGCAASKTLPAAVHPRVPPHIINKKKPHVTYLDGCKDSLSSWLDEYERQEKETSTVQTRISDYFYEINIPK